MDISIKFFMENCVVDRNLETQTIDKISLYPYQKELIEKLIVEDNIQTLTYILSSRQMGVRVALATYVAHQLISKDGFQIIYIGPNSDTIKKFVLTVKNILNSIYSSGVDSTLWSINLKNGSKLIAVGSNKSAGRGEVVDAAIFDNATYIENFSDIWTSILPCLSMRGSGKMILTSDSKFTNESLFYIFKKCNPITFHWSINPFYTEERIEEIKKIVGPEVFKYEYDLVIPEEIFKTESKDSAINVRLEKSLYEKVLKHSAENNISISELIRTLLQEKCG